MKQLTSLRALMAEHNVDALIVPGTDPHASEYIAAHWQERNYVSAFTGSAVSGSFDFPPFHFTNISVYQLFSDASTPVLLNPSICLSL